MTKKSLTKTLSFLLIMTFSTSLFAEEFMFLKTIKSNKEQIQSGIRTPGEEGSSLVSKMSYRGKAPFDLESGGASGRRRSLPFIITKKADNASAQYMELFKNQNSLSELTVKIKSFPKPGEAPLIKVYRLLQPRIVEFEESSSIEDSQLVNVETMAFTYERIQLIKNSKIEFDEEWDRF